MHDALRSAAWEPSHIELKAKPKAYTPASRGWLGAQLTRMQDFVAILRAEDDEIKRDLGRLRAHSRDLTKNNAFMARYLRLVSTNVVGHTGIGMQGALAFANGKLREDLNQKLEDAWKDWGKACTVDQKLSWKDAQRLFIETVARDGEAVVRKVCTTDNAFGFALEFIDADRLDHALNRPAGRNQNAIVMGVEVNTWGKPVAYWIFTSHPNSTAGMGREYARIPASEIIHAYIPKASVQSRGVPWAAPVMYQMNLFGRYWENEVAAAAHEAGRAGFLKTEMGDLGEGVSMEGQILEVGNVTWQGLPPGVDPIIPDVKHPNTAFGEFSKGMLRGIAAGLGVSYPSLASDLSDVNYSSMRGGMLDERDNWRVIQDWMIAAFCEPVFRSWSLVASLSGKLQVSMDTETMAVEWAPRGWDWVDPAKDVDASIKAIEAGLDTRTRVLGAKGIVFRDLAKQLADEQALLKGLGLNAEPKETKADPKKEEDNVA